MARKPKAGNATVLDKPAEAPSAPETPEELAGESVTEVLDDQESGDSTALATGDTTMKVSGIRVTFTKTAAILPAKLSFPAWVEAYEYTSAVRELSKWWQGDLLNQGEARFGEKYNQVLDATGAEYGSLRTVASIAGKFAPERRRPEISWSHHQAVAPLPAEVADRLLQEAIDNGWSVVQIRAEAREWKEEHGQKDEETAQSAPVQTGPRVFLGVQPVDPETLPPGADVYGCPLPEDESLSFAEAIWHCMDCGAHNPDANEECAFCPEAGAATATTTTQTTTSNTGAAVSGQVLTPADQSGIEIGELLEVASIRTQSVASVVKDILSRENASEAMAELAGLHEWTGRVLEGLATAKKPAATKPLSPAPKPGKPSKARKPAAPKAEAPAEEAEDEGLPFE